MAIIHRPTREYVMPVSRKRIVVRFECPAGLGNDWRIVYWNRFNERQRFSASCRFVGGDGFFDCFIGEIETEESVKYIRYYFEANGGSICYGPNGQTAVPPDTHFEYLYTNECDVFDIPEWAKGAIVYQIFPERFQNGDPSNDPAGVEPWGSVPLRTGFMGGDLAGIIAKLDYLAALHVDLIYLTPIFKAPSNHKYDTEDYFLVDPSFGTLEDLRKLTAQCHARGIRVMLDGVFNHCGYTFGPFQDVLMKGEASPYKDWFLVDSFPVQTEPQNYECVGYYKWMPKMRMKNPDVRKFFLEVGQYWIKEADIDGWRLDVADEVDFTFWQEFRKAVKAIKPDALLIAETWKDGGDLLRGDQMDSVMNYLFRDAMVAYFANNEPAEAFDGRIQRLQRLYPMPSQSVLYNLIGSHDTDRFLTLCGGDKRRLMLAAAFQMTYSGMPAIYYGDEIGMTGGNDPDCRKAMDWDGADNALLAYYRRLAELRQAEPALRYGAFETIISDGDIYGFARRFNKETIYVLFNRSDMVVSQKIPAFESGGKLQSLLDGKLYSLNPIDENDRFYRSDRMRYQTSFSAVLPAYCVEIIKIKEETV